eukprot:CAMPEP_0183365088 /NCGR_PEP_ID=MMETSP0164_2-20130417/83340_1 /TAXON_ID=221442 /ORGANISM="Coccolithus pelagicus ssp braarudi, Strain PLY182g" /LENGTH=105 /DNA_ID=CAMNT_0025540541 /DNA_START=16 /DNA_END=330 /DNA_ORIENTATION=+
MYQYEFWLYIAFDAGDSFYDSAPREAQVHSWFDAQLIKPLAARGITFKVALLRFENRVRKPGPAFNYMMAAAYEDGADYLYRINDDTRFAGPWVAQAIGALGSFE